MIQRLTLSLCFAAAAFAQRSDSINQSLFNVTGVQTFPLNATVRNIGQEYHRAMILFSEPLPFTGTHCYASTAPVQMEFQGSFDNTTWFPLGSPLSYVNSPASNVTPVNLLPPVQIEAQGAYPYLRFHIAVYDSTNCNVSVWYSGTLYPTGNTLMNRFDDRVLLFQMVNIASCG